MTDNQTPPSDEQLPQVGWWCWRGDNHGHLAMEPCRSDNVPIHVPVEWVGEMRAVIQQIEEGDDEDDPAASAVVAVAVPPTGQTALRDRIAEALYANDHPGHLVPLNETGMGPAYRESADAVLAVLPPPADRSAVLREEAALIRAHCPDHLDSDSADGAWISCHCDVADDMLRRLADEAQQQPDTQDVPDTVAIRAAELDDTSHLLQVGGNPEGAEFLRKRAALIRTVGKSQPAVPRRGDVIEQWLQAQRDNSTSWSARSELDYLLSQYRLHADTRTPLAEHRDAPAAVSAVPPQPEETA